jgi:hypothetical protein
MWLAVGRPSVDEPAPLTPAETPALADAPAPRAGSLAKPEKPAAAAPKTEQLALDPPPAPAHAPAHAPPTGPPADYMPSERGPIAEYQALYDRHARDSAATEVEDAIRTAFGRSTQPDLLHSASCHESICKVLIRWTPERVRDYVAAMRGLALGTAWPPGQPGFETQIAITTASQKDKAGGRLVELYLKRRSPSAAKPTFAH